MAKEKFIIEPHFRLHEWVAEEKGYFKDEGLDYEFRELVQSSDGASQQLGDKVGAMQTFERGRKSDISCACHWTVNVAATKGHGKLYGDVYQVSTCGIFVPPDSKVKTPEDLAGVPISVGYQSGSHYATIQALEQFMPQDKINLSFKDGLVFGRMEKLLNGEVPACTLFSGPYYFAEQLGFRKVLDCTFMMATMLTGDPDMEDVQKFFRALRRAQADIDLRPELYTKHYKKEFPKRFHDKMDTRRWGPGERIVFEPYSREIFEDSRAWIAEHGIFEGGDLGAKAYDNAVSSTAVRALDARLTFALPRHAKPDVAVERGVVLQQVRRAGAVHDRAALQQQRVLGQRQRDLGVLLHQDDGGAFLGDHLAQAPHQFLDDDRREALQRLVEQQQRRIGHQRARGRQHLLLAAGELVALGLPALLQMRGNSSNTAPRSQRPGRAATVRFSSTDRLAKISRSCATQPMPACARRCGASRVMSVPRQTIEPRRSWVKPIKVSSSVLLPTPFRPSTARLPRSGISKVTSSSTTASP